MSAALELTGTHVKYLLVIYEIGQAGQSVSSADVAKRLEVSRPSVTRMLNVLTEKGLTPRRACGSPLPSSGARRPPWQGRCPRDVSWTKTKKRRMDSASFFRAREGVAGSQGLCYA